MKQEVCTDEQLERLFSEYEIKQPQLFCQTQQKIVRMCVNDVCKESALICNELECSSCGIKIHKRCPNIPFINITEMLTERANRQKEFLFKLCEIENQFIEELHKNRKILAKKYCFGDLEEKYLRSVEEIYKNRNFRSLNGKDAKEFYERLNRSFQEDNNHSAFLLSYYKKEVKKLIYQMLDIKSKLYQSFLKNADIAKQQMLQIDSLILQHPLGRNLQGFKQYSSLIVTNAKSLVDQLTVEQTRFIRQVLKNPKELQLLYRGSENGFSAYAFHNRCNNIPNTFTLVRTEFGKTIGGFTQYTWNPSAFGKYVSDVQKNSFLVSLDLKEKIVPSSQSNLIYCYSSYGPTFGYGHDLHISDQCHKNRDSYAQFPTTYNREGQHKYLSGQESLKIFSGSPNGAHFRVKEYEVFRVIW